MTHIEIDRSAEWSKTLELMQGLFPKWNVTMEQLDAWKLEFGMLNPEWLRESLRVVYGRYNSDNPKVKWVKEAFKEVRAGHQGIPLTESDSADMKRTQTAFEQQVHEQEVENDRRVAVKEVSSWSQEERVKWGTLFANRFSMFSGRNDVNDFSTWSQSFCQFVKVYRKMKTGGNT